MGKNDFSNIDKQIREAVEDAMDSLDFKQLNKTISSTISVAVNEVRKQFINDTRTKQTDQPNQPKPQAVPKTTPAKRPQSAAKPQPAPAPDRSRPASVDKLRIHPPSRTESILLTVFGSIGLGLSLLLLAAILVSMLIAVSVPLVTWVLAFLLLIAAGVSVVLLGKGNSLRGRLKRLKLYLKEADNRTYCSIRALVGITGKPEKYVIRDIKRMIKAGILPHAHIDQEQTCLMLDDETYEQYLTSMESLKQRTQKAQTTPAGQPAGEDDRLRQVTSEGRNYINILREANDAIPGEVISDKLYRLETILVKIFDVAARHPDQVEDMERFMEYYLPTTIKLVNAYRDFDSVGISGENISMVKTDVEETLDTINQAFEQLLDSLYQDEAFDISTDASVLQTMLRKDGYVSSDFDRREES